MGVNHLKKNVIVKVWRWRQKAEGKDPGEADPIYVRQSTLDIITYEGECGLNFDQEVYLLKLDTEGYELNVLLGLGKYLQKVSLIMFEHHFHDMIVKN